MKKMLFTFAAMLFAVSAMAEATDSASQDVVFDFAVTPFLVVVADHVWYGPEPDSYTNYDEVTGVTSQLAWPYFKVSSNVDWTYSMANLVGDVGGVGVLDGWFWNPDADENEWVFNPNTWTGTAGMDQLMALELLGEWGPMVAPGLKTVTVEMTVIQR